MAVQAPPRLPSLSSSYYPRHIRYTTMKHLSVRGSDVELIIISPSQCIPAEEQPQIEAPQSGTFYDNRGLNHDNDTP